MDKLQDQEIIKMTANGEWRETFIEQTINYMLEKDGKLFVIENVPVRICVETGEQLFAPETVERLQQTIWEERSPIRILETPVYAFAA